METLLPLIIQLISGAVGGNIAGALLKTFSLGAVGNSLAGIVGGALGGQLIAILGSGILDGIASDIVSGGIGGGALMIIIGLIKKIMS